jgi:starch phosphorylase
MFDRRCWVLRAAQSREDHSVCFYSAQVSATRSASDYTARITPYHANASLPLESEQILWQR